MSKFSPKRAIMLLSVVMSYIMFFCVFYIYCYYQKGIEAKKSFLMQCMIRHAILKILDSNEMTAEEKVSYLGKQMPSSMEFELMATEMKIFDIYEFLEPGGKTLSQKEIQKVKKIIRKYLDERCLLSGGSPHSKSMGSLNGGELNGAWPHSSEEDEVRKSENDGENGP